MNSLVFIIIITSIAGICGTGAGGCFGIFFKRSSTKTISLLLSFASGVMLSVVCFDLLNEAIEISNISLVILGLSFGYGFVYLLNSIINNTNHPQMIHFLKNRDNNTIPQNKKLHSSYSLLIGGMVTAIAIALHNFPEGMVIGASATDSLSKNQFTVSELTVAIVIGLHNIPEGMAVCVPLIAGGMSKPKTILLTALTGFPTVLGAITGYILGALSPMWLAISLSFASGAMLYVVFGELLPESNQIWNSKLSSLIILLGLILGLLIIFL